MAPVRNAPTTSPRVDGPGFNTAQQRWIREMKASLANVEGRSPEQQAGLIACSSAPPWTKSVKDLVDGIESDVSRDANGARTYHCRWPGCKVTTGDSSHIKRHVKTGHLRDMQDYVCPVPFCGRAGNRLDNLKSHYKRLHIDYVFHPSHLDKELWVDWWQWSKKPAAAEPVREAEPGTGEPNQTWDGTLRGVELGGLGRVTGEATRESPLLGLGAVGSGEETGGLSGWSSGRDLTPPTPADDAMAEWSLCLTLDALASEFLPATDAGTAEERQFAEDLAKVQQQAEEQATLALPEEWYPWEAQY